jgi:diguanylate cyclase (GGDEF)-like protein
MAVDEQDPSLSGASEKATLPGIDVEQALRRLDGDRQALRQIILAFAASERGTVEDICSALDAGRKEEALFRIHRLKGAAANVSAPKVRDAAQRLEAAVGAGVGLPAALLHETAAGIDEVLEAAKLLASAVDPADGGILHAAARRASASAQRILIVDDHPANVLALEAVLGGEYRVLFATGGAEALDTAAALVPDLILLDVQMPDIDGFEVCRRLKAVHALREIPVIFVTVRSGEDDQALGLETGAIDYITKPFNPALVRLRVRNHLEMKRLRDQLYNLSFLDGLTGVCNRRAFDDAFHREWHRAHRSGFPLSIVFLDVDLFKDFNDCHGHKAGDECLARVATVLSRCLQRPADIVARYGGEEFVVLLPETGIRGALVAAERMRASVMQAAIPHARSHVAPCVTVSAGVSSIVPPDGVPPGALIEQADRAMYRAKAEGRNRVCALSFP